MLSKITSVISMFGLALTAAPTAFAGSINVSNDNNASVITSLSVSADTGGNTSTGARGARGGTGGSSSSDEGNADAGNGGAGGAGGDGGDITTGNAIATAHVSAEVNTTDVRVDDNDTEDAYNESLRVRWNQGHETSDRFSNIQTGTESSMSENGQNTDTDESTDTYRNESSGTETSDEYDHYALDYTRTLADDGDDITVANENDAVIVTGASVSASTGDNTSRGSMGARGGSGGDTSTDEGSTNGGHAGDGGAGGNGGTVMTGVSDSLAEVVTVSGRTMVRVNRN